MVRTTVRIGQDAPPAGTGELIGFCWQLQAVARCVQRLLEHQLVRLGTSPDQVWALQLLRERQPQMVATLAAGMALERNSASQLVERLVRQGLAARSRSTEDRRQVLVSLTAAGERLLQGTDAIVADTASSLLEDVGPRPLAGAARVLHSVQGCSDHANEYPVAEHEPWEA